MKSFRFFLILWLCATSVRAQTAPAPEVVTIQTLVAQMRYDVTEFTVAPGAPVKLIFENPDDMPHNIVFFDKGTDVVAASNKQMERPEEALKRNWLPEDPRIWLHTRVLNPKEREELTFKAPEKPGHYPYVCTFPGHAVSMQGVMRVLSPGPRLAGLRFRVYLGDWKMLPDFAALPVHREGEIADGLVALKFDDYKNQYGVVFTGKLTAAKEGEYSFAMACDDGGRLFVNGKNVIEHDGIHPSAQLREAKVKLPAGEHEVRLEFFQQAGGAELFLGWRGPDFGATPLSAWVHPKWKDGGGKKKDEKRTGLPLAVAKEAVIYRNFIAGAGNRGIAVGYPGNVSIAWSAETMNLALVWRGAFMDAARHWNDRGGGHQPPLGYDVFRPAGEQALPFAVLAGADTAWPTLKKNERPEGYAWKGYRLDAQRRPTFSYTWNGVAVTDRIDVDGDALAGMGQVRRTLTLTGAIPAGAQFRVATGKSVTADGAGFLVDGGTFGFEGRNFENKFKVTAEGAVPSGATHLLLPAKAEMKILYSWPHAHAHAAHAH